MADRRQPIADSPLPLLQHWFADPQRAVIAPISSTGFSGARLWRVEHDGRQFALREWPASAGPASRLREIHELQLHVAANGLPTPAPASTHHGVTLLNVDGAWWELATWMPGVADYWREPRPAKLAAAMQILARVHRSAAEFVSSSGRGGRLAGVSPAIVHRHDRTQSLLSGGLVELHAAVQHSAPMAERPLAAEVLSLVERSLPSVAASLTAWKTTSLPTQWRLRDVWHDHVLFTGDSVTGVIDFGAADVDWPAGDVARLLGSLVLDDPAGWQQGLAAYESVHSLNAEERLAVRVFDASGVVLSTANWLHWLYAAAPTTPPAWRRERAVDRLRQFTARLRVQAGKRGY